ncbi:MAG: transposase [Saprospiraceae bacterium]|nr:transposase [Saprospiraceae bacterium]
MTCIKKDGIDSSDKRKIVSMLINTEPKPNIRLALKVSDLSVGAWYDRRSLKTDKCKPGPKSVYSDVEVLQALRKYIAEPIFYLEGYKKLKVRLKEEYGIDVGKERLRRIMTENELLCHQKTDHTHSGIITTVRSSRIVPIKSGAWTSKNFILV